MKAIEMINKISEYSSRPEPFAKGTGNIWTEPYLASRMLDSHLNKSVDGASRKEKTIDMTVSYLSKLFMPAGSVLDLGCGPGLYARRLASLGYRVTGVDFSENSIRYAKEQAEELGLDISYRHDDFFNLAYHDEFDAVMQIYGEMNTFSDADRDRLTAMIYNALRPGGIFVFDVTTANRRTENEKATSWYTADKGFFRSGKHIVLESILPYENDVWLEQYIVADEDSVEVYRNWFHEYSPESISEVLRKAGFNTVDVSDKLYGEEYEEGDWITIIAKK